MPNTLTAQNTKVGMVFAIAETDYDGNDYPGSLYEVVEVVAEASDINGNPLRAYCHARCIDYDDSEDEPLFSFPFDGYIQA